MNRSGSLLIVTLWMVTILAIFVVAIARYLSLEVRLTKYRLAREQAKTLARSGVYLAMERLSRDAKDGPTHELYDWLGDDWAVFPSEDLQEDPHIWVIRIPPHEIRIQITDEERKLDLNAATVAQMTSTPTPLADPPQLAQAIVDYRDEDTAGESPVEQPPYYQKNGPVVALEELADLPGMMTPAAFDRLQQLTTPWSAGGALPAININTAEPDVLLALSGPTLAERPATDVIDDLVSSRPGLNGVLGDSDDCKATQMITAAQELAACALAGVEEPLVTLLSKAAFGVSSSTFRIDVNTIAQPSGARYHIAAVIRRSADPASSPIILSWREGTQSGLIWQ